MPSLNITSPDFIRKPLKPEGPAPLDLETTNGPALLDEMVIAAQLQLCIPVPALRKAWRQRMNDCRAELAKRVGPKGGI